MKKIVLALAVVFAATGLNAQDGKLNAIKINPLSLAFATGNVSYERAVGPQSSIQLGGFFAGFKLSELKYSGFGVTPEFRYYFAGNKEALNGVYVGPFLRYQSFTIKETIDNSSVKFSSFGGGAVIGWQKMWDSGFVLDLFAGPNYSSGKFTDGEETDLAFGLDGLGIRTGITIGFGF